MKISDQQLMEIVSRKEIADQGELVDLLEEKGYGITQASLSRRLKKLNIQKINGRYQSSITNAMSTTAAGTIDKITVVPPNLLFIKTLPGNANALAYQLDNVIAGKNTDLKGIVGTIAGDDAILVVVNDPSQLEKINEKLTSLS